MTWKSFLSICLLSLGLPLTLSSSAQANNFIISNLSGTVEVRWRFSLFWGRATRYSEFGPDHYLRVGDRSSVSITCLDINANWISWTTYTRGEVQVYNRCAASIFPERKTVPSRSSSIDETLPYIISPRNTALFPRNRRNSSNIGISWNRIPNASTYRVRIRGSQGFLWQSDWLNGTSTEYTASLEAGRTYEITVETNQGLSSNPGGSAPPTFRILTDAEVTAVNQKLAQIEALRLDSIAQALAIAQLYRNYNLNQDAIALLEAQIQRGGRNAAIYQLQASIYKQIGLPRQAQERYKLALGLTNDNDLEQRAEIQEHLGLLARSVANHAEAVSWLRAAEATYRQRLDPSLPEVQARLQELHKLIEDSQSRLPAPNPAQQSIMP